MRKVVMIRLSQEEREMIKDASEREGKKMSTWMREILTMACQSGKDPMSSEIDEVGPGLSQSERATKINKIRMELAREVVKRVEEKPRQEVKRVSVNSLVQPKDEWVDPI